MMDSLDIHLDRDEQVQDTEEKVLLQERQDLNLREVLQEHSNAPPSKKIKGNTNVERNERYTEQGERYTEQGERYTDQGERYTDQGERYTEQGERYTEQGQRYTDQGEIYTEQGESSSQVTEGNTSPTAASKEQYRREFEKLVAEYPFTCKDTRRIRRDILETLRSKYYKNVGNIQPPKQKERKIRVAIDCSFDSVMSQRQIKTLVSEMQHCISVNNRIGKPIKLQFINFKDKTLEHFDTVDNYRDWKMSNAEKTNKKQYRNVLIKQETLSELYSVSEVVYLCAESDNMLEELDDDKVYVIGGFVPQGPHEGTVLKKANEAGFTTARLPIQKYFIDSRKVYSIRDLFSIISSFCIVDCWVEAIRSSIPKRRWVVRKDFDTEEDYGKPIESDIQQGYKHERIVTKMSESSNKIRIAIDCSFDSFMGLTKVKRTGTLIQQSYSHNRNMTQPFQLYLTHFKDETLKCFNDHFPLYKDWDIFIKSESLTELYSSSEVVYLCAESVNVLQTLDHDKIYVIGGVSNPYNLAKEGLVLNKAKEGGFITARLPIQEYFSMPQGTVMNIIDAFKILAGFSMHGCWKKAIRGCGDVMKKGLLEIGREGGSQYGHVGAQYGHEGAQYGHEGDEYGYVEAQYVYPKKKWKQKWKKRNKK